MKSWIIGALIVAVVIILVMRTRSFADAMTPPSPAPSPVGNFSDLTPGQKYYFVLTPESPCPPGYYKPSESDKPKICQLNNS